MIKSDYLDIAKLTANKDVLYLFDIVAKHGGVLRFVGGAVRDALMNVKSYDLNLATDLSPEELVEICEEEGYDVVRLGIKQKSIGIIINKEIVEISSLYKYITDKNGSLQVEYTDNWEEDASRRDLTINAVYTDEKGNVFDYYNGIDDLEKGVVRFIGSANQKIKEDPLRILRYFRFYSMYGKGQPNRKAIDACVENCELLKKLPMEKIRDELLKIIKTHRASDVYKLMQDNDVLSYIMPKAEYVDDLKFFNVIAQGQKIDNEEIIKLFILYRPDELLAESLASRLKLNKAQKKLLLALGMKKVSFEDLQIEANYQKFIYLYGVDFCKGWLLVYCTEKRKFLDNLWDLYNKFAIVSRPIFPVEGKDIINFGIADNRRIGSYIKEIEKRWIDSNFALTKNQLLDQFDEII